MSTLSIEQTVGQIVTERPGRSRVFESLGIDYCCGGKQTLAEACAASRLDPNVVLSVIRTFDAQSVPAGDSRDWSKAPMSELCDHIEQTHHAYLKEELPRLESNLRRIASRHGSSNTRLIELLDVFLGFRNELEEHTLKEERVLFPLIRQLEAGADPSTFHCGSVKNPIRVMALEHDDAGNALKRMRQLTDGYVPPPTACNTYRATMDALEHLEKDMHRHVHKENSILFPRAAEREAEVLSAKA